jgi:hypothetical protein
MVTKLSRCVDLDFRTQERRRSGSIAVSSNTTGLCHELRLILLRGMAVGGCCRSEAPMNVEEFLLWMETEPDSYELDDGRPVRMPDDSQGGRKMGSLFRATQLSLGKKDCEWLTTPLPELNGQEPALYVTESWSHLCAALQLLRDPEDGGRLMGDRFSDICNRAQRLAAIERQRKNL